MQWLWYGSSMQITPQTYHIQVKAADSYQMGTESNYIEIMQIALQKYIAEAKTDIK